MGIIHAKMHNRLANPSLAFPFFPLPLFSLLTRLHLIRNDVGLPIFAFQKLIGLVVAHKAFGFGIDMHRTLELVGDFGQMADGRRQVALLYVGVEVLNLTAAAGGDPILEMGQVND